MMTVKRDPFARGEYVRATVTNPHVVDSIGSVCCAWCGSGSKRRYYAYAWESDGALRRAEPDTRRVFCNFGCFSSYHVV